MNQSAAGGQRDCSSSDSTNVTFLSTFAEFRFRSVPRKSFSLVEIMTNVYAWRKQARKEQEKKE